MTGYYLDGLANLYLKTGDLARPRTPHGKVWRLLAKSLPGQHLYIASARQTLGEVLLSRGALAAAETELRAAVDINTNLVGADHWRTARSAASLGWALIKNDRAAEGEPMLVNARTRLLATVGAADPATQLATARLAEYYRSRHRDAEADEVLAGSDKR